ncbi:MAG: Gfo/Idh/MocA family oxidoreductase [Thermodesulfovibrionales bacterium]
MLLKVAVVGVGSLGQHHARIYSELPDVELVGVVDIDRERAKGVALRYGAKAYYDYRDLLEDVDALSIAVPTTYHFGIALDCLREGKDILVEKPITATVAQADELIAEAEKMQRILQVGHLERYNPGVIDLSGMIEEPIFFEALRLSPFPGRSTDVDVTLDLMIHDIDIILSLVSSPIAGIRATGFSFITEKIDEARAWIEFENGVVASLTASRIAKEKQRKLSIFQKNSYIELDYQTCRTELHTSTKPERIEIIKSEYREPLKEELKDFIRCALSREKPRVSGIEGRNALMVALEISSLIRKVPVGNSTPAGIR